MKRKFALIPAFALILALLASCELMVPGPTERPTIEPTERPTIGASGEPAPTGSVDPRVRLRCMVAAVVPPLQADRGNKPTAIAAVKSTDASLFFIRHVHSHFSFYWDQLQFQPVPGGIARTVSQGLT